MNPLSIAALKKHLYNIADRLIENRIPQHIHRNGKRLKISLDEPVDKLSKIKPKNIIADDANELTSLKVHEWNEPKNI